jgi:hypothetical protein
MVFYNQKQDWEAKLFHTKYNINMNPPLTQSCTGCFLRQLINDRLGPDACPPVEIVDDNARVFVHKRQLAVKREVSNERQDKAQLHIARRWGGSPEANRHNLLQDAQLRPIPRSYDLEIEDIIREGINSASASERWSTIALGTVRGIDETHAKEAGNKGVHSSSPMIGWVQTLVPT